MLPAGMFVLVQIKKFASRESLAARVHVLMQLYEPHGQIWYSWTGQYCSMNAPQTNTNEYEYAYTAIARGNSATRQEHGKGGVPGSATVFLTAHPGSRRQGRLSPQGGRSAVGCGSVIVWLSAVGRPMLLTRC
jgi:hypothetical protein